MSFPGMPPQMGGGAAAGMDPQKMQEQQMIKMMQKGMESCPVKMALAGGMGFGLGGLFGLFMASMRYDTPMSSAGGIPGTMGPDGVKVPEIPMRQQIKAGFKDMGKSSWASAKNFGYIGGVYSGSECVIEGFRGKNDLANGVAAGCFTGGFLAKSAGPQAMAIGCAGFAAFSAAIDAYMRMDSNDVAADPII